MFFGDFWSENTKKLPKQQYFDSLKPVDTQHLNFIFFSFLHCILELLLSTSKNLANIYHATPLVCRPYIPFYSEYKSWPQAGFDPP